MAQRVFDRKFGSEFLEGLSTGPGNYLFRDAESTVIYVGKAKNLRRRLQNYRNATRRRVHRKMRTLVREASSLDIQEQPTERQALLHENALIRSLKPAFNVDGAYAFLYPAVGVGRHDKRTLLCFSTSPEAYATLGLTWFGSFRSRPRAKAAFDALVELLTWVGHLEKRARLPAHESPRGSRLVGLRQVPPELYTALPAFFAGEGRELLSRLALLLLAKPRARRDAADVQESLQLLSRFYEMDAVRLRTAMLKMGRSGSFVPQGERDSLFIRAAFPSEAEGA